MVKAYYNEIEPFAAAWLRNLISAGHIAPGDVDERSIEDISPDDLRPYTQCHFFAGIGVWSYALRAAGWDDDRPVWTGSCPCQPFSAAGERGGFADERHLWPAWHYLIDQLQPPVVFGEQVASKDGLNWLDLVSADLEATGYALGAADLCAASVGAPHIRQRLYFVADRMGDPSRSGLEDCERPAVVGAGRRETWGAAQQPGLPFDELERSGAAHGHWADADWLFCRDGRWRPVEPGTSPLAHRASGRMGRLRAYGNAIVAPVAQAFIDSYMTIGRGS